MRELLISLIVHRYKRGLNEVGCHGWSEFKDSQFTPIPISEMYQQIEIEEKLERGEITIEEFLSKLNDYQLIAAFESQCCQDFR